MQRDGIWSLDTLCEFVPQTLSVDLRGPVSHRHSAEVDALMTSINPMFWQDKWVKS